MTETTPYWKSLDGLRAIAVGIVMVAHAGFPFPRSGGVGVDIFFVLSGFLITGILSAEFRNYGLIAKKQFYIRRFLRLSPCLVACVILYIAFSIISFGHVRLDVVTISLTYTANYAAALFQYDLQSMAHCWSLAIEEQFYLVWPLVIALLERHVKTPTGKFLILLNLSLTLALYRAAMVGIFDAPRIYFALDTHMDGLVMGSALAYFTQFLFGVKPEHSINLFFKVLSRIAMPISIFGLLTVMYFITWESSWMGRLGFTFVAIASCVVILDLVASPYSLLRSFFENRILTYFGKISYGLYLYHYPIYHFISHALEEFERGTRVIVMVSLSIVISSLSYHLIEKHFLLLKRRFEHQKKSR